MLQQKFTTQEISCMDVSLFDDANVDFVYFEGYKYDYTY